MSFKILDPASSSMTAGEYIADVVGSEPVAMALLGGTGAAFAFGANRAEAISFGAMAALSKGISNYMLTWAGSYMNLNSYFGNYGDTLDPNDFVGTAVVMGALEYGVGLEGNDLYKAMAVAGVAGVLAPSFTGFIHRLAYTDGTGKKPQTNQSN